MQEEIVLKTMEEDVEDNDDDEGDEPLDCSSSTNGSTSPPTKQKMTVNNVLKVRLMRNEYFSSYLKMMTLPFHKLTFYVYHLSGFLERKRNS